MAREIIDVRIKRADLPDGTPLRKRASSGCAPRASRRRARSAPQGQKQAQIIRAEADAEAAQIYAASFGKDPEFYDFYRAMQSYRHTFGADGERTGRTTSIILSPDNDYLREFRGR